MVLLGLLLAAVAIALGVGLALQPGDTANVHFFGLNIPNLNGRTLILVGIAIGILFMIGVSFIRWGFAIARRRRRERKAAKRASIGTPIEAPADAREPEPEPDHEAARREEVAAWERAEAARREEAARQEEAALRARSENHQPDPYPPGQPDPYPPASPDSYPGHRPPEPYRGDNSPTDAYPTMGEHKTEEYPTVDPYRDEPPRSTGTVYQSGGHSFPDNDPYGNGPQQPPQHRPY
ncbi:hypothetical protein [Cryptosporangium arvum]|uniref:Uncharacterized protein n=1 Tax=Cryptosporangium arvum DSM 44712 TaxID=927661 RepID=A0A010ZQ28_9ACTN|nr:hypothetical protein [Cryptosporangium arvum]EXG79297.1 hypothetical protein CryarDRAFT_0330 [Cryptosporangium arvum DSM 44712]